MNKVTLSIPAISCGHCVHTIKNELSELNGVSSVEVDLNDKKVTIQYSQPATLEEIRNLLKEINYPSQE
jgi:copper chaperone